MTGPLKALGLLRTLTFRRDNARFFFFVFLHLLFFFSLSSSSSSESSLWISPRSRRRCGRAGRRRSLDQVGWNLPGRSRVPNGGSARGRKESPACRRARCRAAVGQGRGAGGRAETHGCRRAQINGPGEFLVVYAPDELGRLLRGCEEGPLESRVAANPSPLHFRVYTHTCIQTHAYTKTARSRRRSLVTRIRRF